VRVSCGLRLFSAIAGETSRKLVRNQLKLGYFKMVPFWGHPVCVRVSCGLRLFSAIAGETSRKVVRNQLKLALTSAQGAIRVVCGFRQVSAGRFFFFFFCLLVYKGLANIRINKRKITHVLSDYRLPTMKLDTSKSGL
jgi:hypothetical protein